MPPDRSHLSQRKFAGRLGCSHTYIQKLLAKGTITPAALNEKGRIDPLVALPEILSSVDESISCITGPAADWLTELREGDVPASVKQIARTPAKAKRAATKPAAPKKTAKQAPPPPAGDEKESITEANRRKAIAEADMKEMARAKERGLLVCAREVELEYFSRARQLRDAILAISDRIAPIVAAESDEHAVRQIIDNEHRTVLKQLSETEIVNG